jgi:hypothetical protein
MRMKEKTMTVAAVVAITVQLPALRLCHSLLPTIRVVATRETTNQAVAVVVTCRHCFQFNSNLAIMMTMTIAVLVLVLVVLVLLLVLVVVLEVLATLLYMKVVVRMAAV